ncbi:ABC transporter ATP-binding protein [Paenibacillus nasutitermitis]|uniref:ABC transporter ATP-binding protein n=1 Tax=Paenibacillus nasutitermitis TaxID=1652958 RepID=A0A916ZEX9_9BACL|nr:ABC transporter ATP-binding protein [Paenibacillus nasutitermitis]GGD93661.1 ABC transporter ATP-binding protein [Paenibacillus nasutitermitis]
METVIDMQGVSWKREDRFLLNEVNWTVLPRQHWALLGLNGSGKTTLLNMINGYLWPTKGRIQVLGRTLGDTDVRHLRQAIGWVSSSLQDKLYGSDTGERIVLSGKFATIGLYDKPSREEVSYAYSCMEALQCTKLWSREYRTCSQGEKQKLLIARALMANPQLLILDEPCNGLDLFSRESLLSAISALASRADTPTLIYVTHHTEEILPLFSHILLLRRGQVVQARERESIMNAEVLSDFFENCVAVENHAGRIYLRPYPQ